MHIDSVTKIETSSISGTSAPDQVELSEEVIRRVQTGVYQFAHDLYKSISADNETNTFCLSPVSIVPVMGMILLALSGKEESQQLIDALHLEGAGEATIHQALGRSVVV